MVTLLFVDYIVLVMLKGICDICGKPSELKTCLKCGKRVCDNHFNNGFCTQCKQNNSMPINTTDLIIPDSAKPTTVKPGDVKK